MFGSYFGPGYFARTYFPGPGTFVEPEDFDVFIRVLGDRATCRPGVDVTLCRPAADVSGCRVRADVGVVLIPVDPGVTVQ